MTHLSPIKCAMSSHVWARSGRTSECIPYACFGQSQTHAGIPLHSKDACNTGTVDSARSSLAHHRPRVDLNARMTSVAPAQNGAFMHIPTKTPRVYGLTTPTYARRRAGHPLAGGRLGKQNAVRRTILGRFVSFSRKNRSILEDAVRQAYSRPDSL